jgi:hypothetical protein
VGLASIQLAQNIIKIDLKDRRREELDWIHLAQDRVRLLAVVTRYWTFTFHESLDMFHSTATVSFQTSLIHRVHYLNIKPMKGRAVAHGVSRRALTAETQFRIRASPSGTSVDKMALGQVLLPSFSAFPCQYRSTVALYTHISSGGPLVAAVQRKSLNPLTWTTKSLWRWRFQVRQHCWDLQTQAESSETWINYLVSTGGRSSHVALELAHHNRHGSDHRPDSVGYCLLISMHAKCFTNLRKCPTSNNLLLPI